MPRSVSRTQLSYADLPTRMRHSLFLDTHTKIDLSVFMIQVFLSSLRL